MTGVIFWMLTAAVAAGLGGLVLMGAALAARRSASGVDPALAVHRRQLAELDDLAARGLLAEDERRAARAEAGRRLLAAETAPEAETEAPDSSARVLTMASAGVAAAGALALYLLLGSPGFGDQPFQRRLESWRSGDPSRLGPPELAAVMRSVARDRPNDPQALTFLGRVELEAGDVLAAAKALGRATQLKPNDAEAQSLYGQALVAADPAEKVNREAEAAFRRALAIDPTDVAARFYLAQAEVQAGRRAEGAAALRELAASLPAGDPRRARVEEEARTAEGGAAVAAAAANAPQEAQAQAAFIQAMVDRLAARLKTAPDDPDGWARLVRAYGVLGKAKEQQEALAEAKKLFAGRPADLAKVEAEAGAR